MADQPLLINCRWWKRNVRFPQVWSLDIVGGDLACGQFLVRCSFERICRRALRRLCRIGGRRDSRETLGGPPTKQYRISWSAECFFGRSSNLLGLGETVGLAHCCRRQAGKILKARYFLT